MKLIVITIIFGHTLLAVILFYIRKAVETTYTSP